MVRNTESHRNGADKTVVSGTEDGGSDILSSIGGKTELASSLRSRLIIIHNNYCVLLKNNPSAQSTG